MNLVTGATGFIGSHVLYTLLKSGRHARAVYRNPSRIEITRKIFGFYDENPDALIKKAEWVQAELSDMQSVSESMEDIKHVYHAAGLISYLPGEKKLLETVNIKGTENVVNACLEKGVKKLMYVSSVASLGDIAGGPADESSHWKPGKSNSRYSYTKYKGEMEVWRGMNEGLDSVIVNPSVVIGPGMWFGASGAIIEELNRGLRFYTEGAAGYVDVRDVASALIKLADSDIKGERFILNSENMHHRDVIDLFADALGKKRPAYRVTPFMAYPAIYTEKLISALTGRRPRFTDETLKTAAAITSYDNGKIKKTLGFGFIPVKDSVKFASDIYLGRYSPARPE
jgi:nucleoside-diphosphate-sugar epimerase